MGEESTKETNFRMRSLVSSNFGNSQGVRKRPINNQSYLIFFTPTINELRLHVAEQYNDISKKEI